MEEKEFKYIVGEALENKPAVIRFHGPVTAETARRFNEEFLCLQNYYKPSKIIVLINSEGGSVVSGMSVFSAIQSCPIETLCIIEGIAASMGGVIWAAGEKLYMHDYSILMIHNPFANTKRDLSEDDQATLKAFRAQLETIYCKRFGLDAEKVRSIMDGDENLDGTYLSAQEAVEAGILPKEHIIHTSEQVRADISSKLQGISGAASIRDVMASLSDDQNQSKLIEKALTIIEQNKQNNQSEQIMNEKELTFDSVCAQIGIDKAAPVANVSSRVAELVKAETDLASVKAELEQQKIQLKGKEAEVANLTEQINEAKASLKVYQDAEVAAKSAKIEAMVDTAIKDGKISADSKAEWIEMANTNLPMVEKTLAAISPREVITEKIANDPANIEAAAKTITDAEAEVQAKLNAAIGKEFKFSTF